MWTDSARLRHERHGNRYATDLTSAAFALIEPFLPPPWLDGRSRKTSVHEVLIAILDVLQGGCPSRACRPRPFQGSIVGGRSIRSSQETAPGGL